MWYIEFTKKAQKQFSKIDQQSQTQIVSYLDKVAESDDPFAFGKALVGEYSGFWRYRVGKYRLICEIIENRLVIEIISLGKRDKVYR